MASNRLEMLHSPHEPHHDDDQERRRIQRLADDERAALQLESLKTINEIRAEFRRREGA